MSSVQSILALAAMLLACAGYGMFLLHVFGIERFLQSALERSTTAFVIGLGLFGWLLFFPGILGVLTPALIWALAVLGVGLLAIRFRSLGVTNETVSYNRADYLLLCVIFLAAGMDLLEGIAPPADADTLAYHFALPAQFVADGTITFVPRAVSGAIPMLTHMTYAAAFAMGGELTLTLWAMLCGWAPGLLMYAVLQRYVDRGWALALLAVFVTTPAVLYGGGSGQIELLCAAFALASVLTLLTAEREYSYRALALAGVCAGFFIGAKYFGLIFAAAAGLIVIYHRDGFRRGMIYSLFTVLAGCQWYIWNYVHTGDPVFPMLSNMLQFPDTHIWNLEFGAYFAKTLAIGELPLERSIVNWLMYPVYSIFNLVTELEGGRTGLGVLLILILPFTVLGLASPRNRRRDFMVPLAVALVFYTVWFFSGTTQRTRHLLPIYPLLLCMLYPAAIEAVTRFRLHWPLATGLAILIFIQIAGQSIFTISYARYFYTGETRASFLDRNVPGANSARWINRNLPEDAKIGFMNRQLAYLIERTAYMMHPHIQAVVDTRPDTTDAVKFLRQIRRQDLTHLLIPGDWEVPAVAKMRDVPFFDMIGQLLEAKCLRSVHHLDTQMIPSRTLKQFGEKVFETQDWVFEIEYDRCPALQ